MDQLKMMTGFKTEGNDYFKKKQYAHAALSYSCGLSISPTDLNLLSNRAAAYLNMGLYAKALIDTEEALRQDPTHAKCIFRKVKSLWSLKKYQEASDFIQNQVPCEIIMKNKDLQTLEEKSHTILEQSKGKFNILDIMKLPKTQRNDIGEYQGPLVIKSEISGKGRGIVATEDIQMGQLLICSKAFSIVFDEDLKVYKEAAKNSEWAEGVENIYQVLSTYDKKRCCAGLINNNLYQDPNYGDDFFELYSKSDCDKKPMKYDPSAANGMDEKEITEYNINFTFSIVSHNGFEGNQEVNPFDKEERPDFFGLWILPSYLNHSCIDSNAYYSIYGDVMLIRAVKDIKKDEEITIAYWPPRYPDRLEVIKSHNFQCYCRACEMDRKESPEVTKEIKNLVSLIEAGVESDEDLSVQVERIDKIISLREAYPNTNYTLIDLEGIRFKLFATKEWEQYSLYLLEKSHEVTKNNCFVLGSVHFSVILFLKYWQLQIPDGLAKWWKQVKLDAIAAFGSTDGLIALGEMTEEQINDYNELEMLTGFQDYKVPTRDLRSL